MNFSSFSVGLSYDFIKSDKFDSRLINNLEYLCLCHIRHFNTTTGTENKGDSVSSLGGLNIGVANARVCGKADEEDMVDSASAETVR